MEITIKFLYISKNLPTKNRKILKPLLSGVSGQKLMGNQKGKLQTQCWDRVGRDPTASNLQEQQIRQKQSIIFFLYHNIV